MAPPVEGLLAAAVRPRRRTAIIALAATAAAVAAMACATELASRAQPKLDVPYEPTPPQVVDAMLDLAGVGPGDVVYDLGCGDGRLVVGAARRGARGVGIDLDPVRVRESRENARTAGVEDRTEFREGDLFDADVGPATVVTLFLWPEVNLRLRPRLVEQLRPGSRVVSYIHDMGTWEPDRTVVVAENRNVYLWTIRPR